MTTLLQPDERVLSTLNADGSRRWIKPRLIQGVLYQRRRVFAWFLIAIFVTLPFLHWNGRQLFFANIAAGELVLFGRTFIRTDTLLLALTLLSIAVTIFLATALVGRVWCGWACPQTVYTEFVFRPLGRLFDGKAKKGLGALFAPLPKAVRGLMRWTLVAIVCFVLANTFLSYFIGSATLLKWITQAPWVHPVGFAFVMFVTAAMVFDFGFFREQLCIVACPYGRLQSVLLDRQSLIVGYDYNRGEPRGKFKRNAKPKKDLSLKIVEAGTALAEPPAEPAVGDCVDCGQCIAVCPTGIDIREGLQLECINCAQCIDACNSVMSKIGRDTGLIRYTSQDTLETGKTHVIRPRVVIYPAILAVLLTALSVLVVTKPAADINILRSQGTPFNELATGEITNQARIRITNRTGATRTYTWSAPEVIGLASDRREITLEPGSTDSERVLITAPMRLFEHSDGQRNFNITITDDDGHSFEEQFKLLGPAGGRAAGAAP